MDQLPKARPILFSAPMVRALLEGRKTQTRRVVKTKTDLNASLELIGPCRYGRPGDLLWVRERWGYKQQFRNPSAPPEGPILYSADAKNRNLTGPWRSSRIMPRVASRIVLQVSAVRIEMLQHITPADARAEGFDPSMDGEDPLTWFHNLWDSINSVHDADWETNPRVWVVTFALKSVSGKSVLAGVKDRL